MRMLNESNLLKQQKAEKQWVEDCLAGNIEAFQPLVESSEKIVKGMVANIIHDSAQADEIAQQSFIAAFEKLPQFKGQSKFSTWVCSIAINKCRDYLRTRKDFVAYEENLDQNNIVHDTPETILEWKQTKLNLRSAIDKLKSSDKELITFKYLCGFDYELISDILECSVQTAKVRSLRAREKLKNILLKSGLDRD
jgi:RNA polymerase sigma-70 factor (ECF subfamily)